MNSKSIQPFEICKESQYLRQRLGSITVRRQHITTTHRHENNPEHVPYRVSSSNPVVGLGRGE